MQTRNQLTLCLVSFYKNQQHFFKEFKQEIDKFAKEIEIPLVSFKTDISDVSKTTLLSLHQSIQGIEKQRIKLTKAKMNYYKGCNVIQDKEKQMRVYLSSNPQSQKKLSKEKIREKYEVLMREKVDNESKLQLYHDEIARLNHLYGEYEIAYEKATQSFANYQKNKGSFIKCIIEKWNKSMSSIFTQGSNSIKTNSEVFTSFDPANDKQIFNEEFKESLHCSFETEEFVPFDKNSKENEHWIEEERNKNYTWKVFNSVFSINMNDSNYKEKSKVTEAIQLFINDLSKENNIKSDLILPLMELNDKNTTFPYQFIACYKTKPLYSFYEVKNISNLHHLSTVLNTILMNITLKSKSEIELVYSIVLLSENTYCNSIFLTSLISKNKLFTMKENWITLVDYHIKNKKEKIPMDDYLVLNNDDEVIHIAKEEEMQKRQKSYFSAIDNVMKQFICHFGNFCLDYSEANELIALLCKKYNVDDDQGKYYASCLDTSYFSIRKRVTVSSKDKLNTNQRPFRDFININQGDMPQGIDNASKNTEKRFSLFLLYYFDFIEFNDHLSLMLLNKVISRKVKHQIYKHILFKYHPELALKTHISIWESKLNIHQLKAQYPYHIIINSNLNKEIEKNEALIELDANRTFFKTNITQSRALISRVFRFIKQSKADFIYCQGMNYIASFIYEIVKEEDKTFYLLLGLFSSTDYSTVFLKDLDILNLFFYTCERLIYLYLPELDAFFSSHSFQFKYFGSPWLLTLFSNVYPFVLKDSIPNVLLRIWDMFLLKGWKGLYVSLLGLLKYHMNEILKLNYEELNEFLINNLAKSKLFNNDHYSLFIKYTSGIKVPTSLLKSLEKQFLFEKQKGSLI